MRLIDADKLLARYKVRCVDCEQTQNYCKYLCDLADVISDLEDAPTIEERKKGKWILSDEQRQEDVDNGNYRFICSECGKSDIHSKAVTVSFCWNCGADMREGDNDEVH